MNIYERTIEKFGKEHQIEQLKSELIELVYAIDRYQNNKYSNVEEEIADVMITLEQGKLLFDNDQIKTWHKFKIKRLEELVNAE